MIFHRPPLQRVSRAPTSPDASPHPSRDALLVLVLLAVAGVIDFITGPGVTAAGLYIFPVALAGWRLNRKWNVGIVLAVTIINVVADLTAKEHPLPVDVQAINEAMHFVVYAVAAFFTMKASEQQRSLARQRDTLEHQRDALEKLNRQMEDEMLSARKIQQLLLGGVPTHPAIDLAVYAQPARILGGDFVDFSISPDEVLSLAIGDVSGKGSPAALAGAVMQGLLDDAPARYVSPAETLSYLNRQLTGYLPEEMFVTLFYALLDLRTGRFIYASAGHEPPLRFTEAGESASLPANGFPLGWFPDPEYVEVTGYLHPGDLVFGYTDGLTEFRRNGEDFLGAERVRQIATLSLHEPDCRGFLRGVRGNTLAGTEEIADDITMVALRFQGEPRPQRLRRAAPQVPLETALPP